MRRIPVANGPARIVTFALALLSVVAGGAGCEKERPGSPDLILITVDRLAADRIGCFGGPSDAGGSVCALGQRGTLFAWAASPGLGEASGAATVLTGLSEAAHGIGRDGQRFLADHQRTIAEDLSKAGYATAAFVASSRVNRSRRFDQGFDHYDDHLASPSRRVTSGSVDLSSAVRSWIESAPSSPWFVWIHADPEAGLVELDRLLSRLSQTLDHEDGGPGILFVALRGESQSATLEGASDPETITWRSHRVPLIWRPPTREGHTPSAVSVRLAGLVDIAPTLRAAAGIPALAFEASTASRQSGDVHDEARRTPEEGLDLSRLSLPKADDPKAEDRFVLLESPGAGGDIGLASKQHLYVRRTSPLDGTGRPVPTASLTPLDARFASLPEYDPIRDATPRSARLEPGPWRNDVLKAESPVPRLEFHLARQLRIEHHLRQQRQQNLQQNLPQRRKTQ